VLLITMSISVAGSRLEVQKIATTKQRIEFIAKVLDEYIRTYAHLPCPASPSLAFDAADFGDGLGTGDTAANNCVAAGLQANGAIHMGAIPVKTLEIPDIMVLDGWERRFSYIVDENLTNETGYSANPGTITITNADATPDNISTEAAVVIISHGKNMFGSYGKEGGTQFSLAGGSDDEDENANFTGDSEYVDIFQNSDFDDVVLYRNKWQLAQ